MKSNTWSTTPHQCRVSSKLKSMFIMRLNGTKILRHVPFDSGGMVVTSLPAEVAWDWVQACSMADSGLLCGQLNGPRPQLVSLHSLPEPCRWMIVLPELSPGVEHRAHTEILQLPSFAALRNYIHFIFIQKIWREPWDGLVGKILAAQGWQPEFRFPTPRLKLEMAACFGNHIANRK